VQVVVGAAILRAGQLLAAQRSRPAALAGYWELPGGKVERGEDERAALARECREELGVAVAVGDRVGPEVPISDGMVLRTWSATILSGTPYAHEHAALRWLTAAEISELPWLPADAPLIPHLQRLLAG
jgi:8-oxo-dGTP diphosphatase